MDRDRALERLLERARTDPAVLAVIVFGSAARTEDHPGSDLDVCLVLAPGRRTPADLTEKRLDYLQIGDLDVSVFQALPIYIRHRVLRDGQVHYVRDENALYEVAYRAVQAYEDFKHIYRDYLAQVSRG